MTHDKHRCNSMIFLLRSALSTILLQIHNCLLCDSTSRLPVHTRGTSALAGLCWRACLHLPFLITLRTTHAISRQTPEAAHLPSWPSFNNKTTDPIPSNPKTINFVFEIKHSILWLIKDHKLAKFLISYYTFQNIEFHIYKPRVFLTCAVGEVETKSTPWFFFSVWQSEEGHAYKGHV